MKTLTAVIACCFAFISTSQISSTEKQALIDFYNSTKGNEWFTPWDFDQPESNWFGVTIKDNKVVAIDLGFNNLQGEIPASIENLENLESLKLYFNQIGGTLPNEIGNLKNLKVLDLNSNNIAGTIPVSFENLINLESLLLSSNNLSGTLPSEIGNLRSLKNLVLFDNHFYGDFPVAISELENLTELIIANNNFNTETLQTSLASLTAKGTLVDFNEPKKEGDLTKTEFATLVLDDEDN